MHLNGLADIEHNYEESGYGLDLNLLTISY